MTRIAVFISIPRNGSKTVLNVLDLGENRDIDFTDSLVIYENHQRGSVLSARYDLAGLFAFCFCRNPYDRCISWYEYHKPLPPYRAMSFEAWIKAGLPHHWVRQNQTNYQQEGISPLLQYHFVENCKIDFIGRFEHFGDDLRRIIERLNAICDEKQLRQRFSFRAAHRNRSARRPDIDSYYTEEMKQIVYYLLRKDFEYFDYQR